VFVYIDKHGQGSCRRRRRQRCSAQLAFLEGVRARDFRDAWTAARLGRVRRRHDSGSSTGLDYARLSTSLVAGSLSIADIGKNACPDLVQPTLVFSPVGGFGDRLKGMVTAFYASLLTHARFRVAWTRPSVLAGYFEVDPSWLWSDADDDDVPGTPPINADIANPGIKVGARFEPGSIQAHMPGAAIVRAVDDREYLPFFDAAQNDFVGALAPPNHCKGSQKPCSTIIFVTSAHAWLTIVRLPALRITADAYGLSSLTQRELFTLALRVLLRHPSAPVLLGVETAIAGVLDVNRGVGLLPVFAQMAAFSRVPEHRPTWRMARRWPRGARLPGLPSRVQASPSQAARGPPALIGIQIRTGGVGETWSDSSLRHPVDSAACFARRARTLCQQVYGGACIVYLSTDSQIAADLFAGHMNGTRIIRAGGAILHTDRPLDAGHRGASPANAPAGDPWLRTYVDWVSLAQVDVLLISHGGFGWTAAWAGGVRSAQQLRLGGEAACDWVDLDGCAGLPA
jgi:hypothetical protein